MENYYPYSENEMKKFSIKKEFQKKLKEYLWHRSRYRRGLYSVAVSPYDLAGIRLTCSLLYQDLKELDAVRCHIEVPDL